MTTATELIEVATESEENVVIIAWQSSLKKEKKGENFRKKNKFLCYSGPPCTSCFGIWEKKSNAVCGFLAYFCAVLRFLDLPYAPSYQCSALPTELSS